MQCSRHGNPGELRIICSWLWSHGFVFSASQRWCGDTWRWQWRWQCWLCCHSQLVSFGLQALGSVRLLGLVFSLTGSCPFRRQVSNTHSWQWPGFLWWYLYGFLNCNSLEGQLYLTVLLKKPKHYSKAECWIFRSREWDTDIVSTISQNPCTENVPWV